MRPHYARKCVGKMSVVLPYPRAVGARVGQYLDILETSCNAMLK